MIKKIKILSIIVVLILMVLCSYNVKVYAIADRAAALYGGSQFPYHAQYGAQCYANLGYTCVLKDSPSSIVLRSNMTSASVLLLAGHGSEEHINLVNSGIVCVDVSDSKYIDTRTFNWGNYGTKLVTFMGCRTAGDGGINPNSVAGITASKGAESVVGFKLDFDTGIWGQTWSERYHEYLQNGYGVWDAIGYANSFPYIIALASHVKSAHLWYHSDSNMPITLNNTAKVASNINSNISDNRNILSIEKQNVLSSDIESITTNISKYYPNFDINNYEIVHNTASATNVDTEETTEIEYTDFILKIGDFITNAGFTVVSQNDKIVQIFDNNIDIVKQEEALKNPELFVADENGSDMKTMKDSAISQMQSKYPNTLIKNNIEHKFYYDVENDKKYIIYNVPSVITNHQNKESVLYESIQFEI